MAKTHKKTWRCAQCNRPQNGKILPFGICKRCSKANWITLQNKVTIPGLTEQIKKET